jgi:hypothetical protein
MPITATTEKIAYHSFDCGETCFPFVLDSEKLFHLPLSVTGVELWQAQSSYLTRNKVQIPCLAWLKPLRFSQSQPEFLIVSYNGRDVLVLPALFEVNDEVETPQDDFSFVDMTHTPEDM